MMIIPSIARAAFAAYGAETGLGLKTFVKAFGSSIFASELAWMKNILSVTQRAQQIFGGNYIDKAAGSLVQNLLKDMTLAEARILVARANRILNAGAMATKHPGLAVGPAALSPKNPYVGKGVLFDPQGNVLIGIPTYTPGTGTPGLIGVQPAPEKITQYEVIAALQNPRSGFKKRFVTSVIAPEPMSLEDIEEAAMEQLNIDQLMDDTPGLDSPEDWLGITVQVIGIQGIITGFPGSQIFI